jgi:hemolysin III
VFRAVFVLEHDELFNIASHFLGLVLSIVGIAHLLAPLVRGGDGTRLLALSIYGGGLLATYTTSVLFHASKGSIRRYIRRFDRSAIYLLIGGSYTPVLLTFVPREWAWGLLALVWTIAAAGIVIEWRSDLAEEPHSIRLYLILGWLSLPVLVPVGMQAGLLASGLLLAGGVFFTAGSLTVRLRKRPGSHELWHLLVLAATALHYLLMFLYVR